MKIQNNIRTRLSNYSRLAVWGAGGLGKTAIRDWLPKDLVTLVVDSNPGLAGVRLANCNVEDASNADFSSVDAIVICTSAYLEVRKELTRRGYTNPTFYIYELFLPQNGVDDFSDLDALAIDIAVSKNDIWPRFLLLKPQIIVNITFRIGNWSSRNSWRRPIYWLFFFLHHIACLATSIQLPLGTPIGPGLLFAHYGTIVFTRRAKIGAFFTIYHGCTVGTNDSGDGPFIGDFVYQYAGSHVLGKCHIGDRARIGANAVVLDFNSPPAVTLVGVPARIAGKIYERAG